MGADRVGISSAGDRCGIIAACAQSEYAEQKCDRPIETTSHQLTSLPSSIEDTKIAAEVKCTGRTCYEHEREEGFQKKLCDRS